MPDSHPLVFEDRVALLRTRSAGNAEGLACGALGQQTGANHPAVFDGAVIPELAPDEAAAVQWSDRLPRDRGLAVLFSSVVGSRAYGLASPDSDTDRRGFFVAGAATQFSLDGPPQQLVHDRDQLCYWEIEKFLTLALKANPTVLETLYSPVVEHLSAAIADPLSGLKERGVFLSRRAFHTFRGYADAQFDKMQRSLARGGSVKWHHAMHLIRLMRSGLALIETGRFDITVDPETRDELLAIRRGEVPWEDVKRLHATLRNRFDHALPASPLPEKPDHSAAETFLINLRLEVARAHDET